MTQTALGLVSVCPVMRVRGLSYRSLIKAVGSNRIRALDRRLFDSPHDPARQWRGTAGPDRVDLRVLRFGGCEFRSMPLSHTVASEAGYPRHLAEMLAASGTLMEFSDVFTPSLETLPRTPEALRQHVKLTGAPDVVLVQVGTHYAYRTIAGLGRRRSVVRDRVGLALGRGVFVAYAVANPFFRSFGRPYLDYTGAGRLADFLGLVRREWPAAQVLAMGLFPVFSDGAFSPVIQSVVSHDVLDVAARAGIECLSMDDVLPRNLSVYCANGAQLNEEGSRLVGEVLFGWLAARGLAERHARANVLGP